MGVICTEIKIRSKMNDALGLVCASPDLGPVQLMAAALPVASKLGVDEYVVSCNLGVRGHRHGGSHLKYFSRGHQLTPLGGHGGDDGGRRAIPFSSPVVAWVCVFFATVVLVVGVVEEENVRMVGGGIGEMP
eukprot:s3520_g18.t1